MSEIFSLGNEIVSLLKGKQKTIFTAESCTAGLVSHSISKYSGASEILLGGVVAYHNNIKINLLDVDPQTLEQHGAVSFECAKEMALGAKKISQCHYALAVTGIAGPGGGTAQKPVGTVFLALMTPTNGTIYHCLFEGTREEIQAESTAFLLKLIITLEKGQKFVDSRIIAQREF